MILRLADWTDKPGPRLISQGDWSGELWFRDKLQPCFQRALAENQRLTLDLSDVEGLATVFLDQTIGLLARMYGSKTFRQFIQVFSTTDEDVDIEVRESLEAADRIRADNNLKADAVWANPPTE